MALNIEPRSPSNRPTYPTVDFPNPPRSPAEARKQPARREPLQHRRLDVRADVRLRARVHDRDAREAPRVHNRRLVRQVRAPARRNVDRAAVLHQAREHPPEVARARARAVRLAGRGERRRAVVDVQRHARGEDRARGGPEERVREVGGERSVQQGGECAGGVGGGGERGEGDLGGGPGGERGGGDAFFRGFARRAAVRLVIGVDMHIMRASGTYTVPEPWVTVPRLAEDRATC